MACRRRIVLAGLALLAAPLFPIAVARAAELQEGRDCRRINPPIGADAGRIEVVEFFWYGCPHCNELEPHIAAWLRKLPADVSFRRVPAVFPNSPKWAPGARTYYALEAMNLLDRLHADVFAAIHVERRRLDDEKVLLEWITGKGVDARDFLAAWSSFGVQSRVRQALEISRRAGLTGVPAIVVDGRYEVRMTENLRDLPGATERLIERARSERGRR
jgi:thiol:disulfide interchange protein DsbA